MLWVTALTGNSTDSNNLPFHFQYFNNYNVQTKKSWESFKQTSDVFPWNPTSTQTYVKFIKFSFPKTVQFEHNTSQKSIRQIEQHKVTHLWQLTPTKRWLQSAGWYPVVLLSSVSFKDLLFCLNFAIYLSINITLKYLNNIPGTFLTKCFSKQTFSKSSKCSNFSL